MIVVSSRVIDFILTVSPGLNQDNLCLPQQEKRIFNNFHRQLFCMIDNWVELTMDDIRQMEAETQRELEEVSAEVKMWEKWGTLCTELSPNMESVRPLAGHLT